MRSSVRELLAIVAFLAIAIASLRVGGVLATSFLAFASLCFLALSIVALVARDRRRAFAIGFVVPFTLYATIHYMSTWNELDPHDENSLATTQAFRPLFDVFVNQSWTENLTGKELSEFTLNPESVPQPEPGVLYVSQSGTAGIMTERPDRSTFMLVGHCLLASVAGFVGGKFAVFVHASDRTLTSE